MTRDLQPCGTTGAYQRHLLNGETPCDACREANRNACRMRRVAGNRDAERRANRVRQRALWVLADIHRDEFNRIQRQLWMEGVGK